MTKNYIFLAKCSCSFSFFSFIWKIDSVCVNASSYDLSNNIDKFSCNAGYFSEYHASSLLELSNIITRKYQTLAYYGFSKKELNDFIADTKPFGIDRIVPIGKTMDFSLVWDGYELINTFSRRVEIV